MVSSRSVRKRVLFYVLLLALIGGALAFRLPRLDQRPLHTDEAVHAEKFWDLLENENYRYDFHEYHGPTLNYFTLPLAWLSSIDRYVDTTEWTLRLVCVIFGIALIVLLIALKDALGPAATLTAALLTAVSPAMVYYSRYYIMEILLVFFTFGVIAFGWRYFQNLKFRWALLLGFSLGLMHATKETFVIPIAAMLLALGTVILWQGDTRQFLSTIRSHCRPRHIIGVLIIAVFVSILFFSSFFSNPQGPLDSLRTYATYLNRASDDTGLHNHPWHFYLHRIIYCKFAPGPFWSEGLIVFLAIIGAVAALTRKLPPAVNLFFARFLTFYTLFMTVVYSLLPYKTPWCMLGFLHGMILLAGLGVVALLRWIPTLGLKFVTAVLLLAAGYNLATQAHMASFRLCADNRNPYVYAHTSTDLLNLVQRVEDIAAIHPQQHNMIIQIIAEDRDYWPLPWYLRSFDRGKIGYYNQMPESLPASLIIIAPRFQNELEAKLKDKYHHEIFGLRPAVPLIVYIRDDLWQKFLDTRR